jgi:hypothetical protein
MNTFEIFLLSIGTLVALAGIKALLRGKHYTKPVSVRRFDDI